MEIKLDSKDFFKVGGTLHPSSPSYVVRLADEELFNLVDKGQFCYVLTSRQSGKSSLMIRIANRLRREGCYTAIVDLSSFGTVITAEQWYLGIIIRLSSELQLNVNVEKWWNEHSSLGITQRFLDFIDNIILLHIQERIIIFCDEIDTTLKLSFTDDFFAAIRLLYNLRATNQIYERLTFVLLGVATPTDIIKDRQRTPFNIGTTIELSDLSRNEANALEQGLEITFPGLGHQLLDRIFHWTNGHPYLTQKLCYELIQLPCNSITLSSVDDLVSKLFFKGDWNKDENLQTVRNSIIASRDRRRLLQLYYRIHMGRVVRQNKNSVIQNHLRLIGLICVKDNILFTRNLIYHYVFDVKWIQETNIFNWPRFITVTAAITSIIMIFVLTQLLITRENQKTTTTIQTSIEGFQKSENTDIKMYYLSELCNNNASFQAIELFESLNMMEQIHMFENADLDKGGKRFITVTNCIYPSLEKLEDTSKKDQMLMTICQSLNMIDQQEHKDSSEKSQIISYCKPIR